MGRVLHKKMGCTSKFSSILDKHLLRFHIFQWLDRYIHYKREQNDTHKNLLKKKINHDQEIRFFDKNELALKALFSTHF